MWLSIILWINICCAFLFGLLDFVLWWFPNVSKTCTLWWSSLIFIFHLFLFFQLIFSRSYTWKESDIKDTCSLSKLEWLQTGFISCGGWRFTLSPLECYPTNRKWKFIALSKIIVIKFCGESSFSVSSVKTYSCNEIY